MPDGAARYRAAGTVAAAALVAGAALAATLIGPSPAPARLPTPHLLAATGHVSVAQLTAYHWDALPDAPIPVREDGVAVWTGSRLLVWGGRSSSGTHADGAAYDPANRSWQRLPAAPLSARAQPAFAWTGDRLFVWGGHSRNPDTVASDGATYDPHSRTWHRVPPLSAGDHQLAAAVWTGSRVVLFTAAAEQDTTTVAVHAYNPAKDSWQALASIHITQTDLLDLSALVAGDRLYVWMPVQTIGNGLRPGNDGFRYRPAANRWAPTTLLPARDGYSVGAAQWTGDHILFEPNGLECSCGGRAGESTGSWADPRTGAIRPLPAWLPEASYVSAFVWTGADVLATAGPRAAAWDPGTGRWTKLAGPPYQGGAVQVWTGSRLLIWGQLSALPARNPNAGSPPTVSEPTGLEFRP